MKRNLTLALIVLCNFFSIKADNCIESYNIVSEEQNYTLFDIPIVRVINGGTIIIPAFDESCPENIKGAFSYACKIMEEYLPPCLPINVKVSCGRISGAKEMLFQR